LGGFLVSAASWHWIFFINIPILVLSFIFCFKHLSESKSDDANRSIDWAGFILLATAVPAFVLAIVQGEFWGWLSAPVLALFGFSLLGFVALYFVEKKIKSPIIKFDLFTNRMFVIGLVANFSLAFFYAIDFFLIPLYLDEIHGQSALHIGLSLLPATAMMALLPPLTGKWVDRRGPKGVLLLGCAFLAISAVLQIGFREAEYFYFMLLAYTLFGMGFACILGPSIVAAMSSVPKAFSGVAIGTIGTVHNFGGAIGLAVGTTVYSLYAGTTLHLASAQPQQGTSFLSGYSHALWVLVALSVVTFIVILCGLKQNPISSK
jgi:MFS family permease